MTKDTDICPKCQRPTTSATPGSITQWLYVCRCNQIDESLDQDTSIRICASCGKAINEGRKGTITQYIFRADTCACDNPDPIWTNRGAVESKGEFVADPALLLDDLDELDVSEEEFPKGRYKPVAVLGTGSTGKVYLAIDRLLNKKVAVKTLHQLEPTQLISFQEEAKATSLLNHPNIVTILDFGVTEKGTPYMVLEHIPGVSLHEYLAEHGPVDWTSALELFLQIVNALEYAHNANIMHRDLKPSNIIITQKDDQSLSAKIIDFGVAHVKDAMREDAAEQGKTIVGTPNYMSPDQGRGLQYSRQSEVYSVGCVLFESLSGSPPFSAETALELIRLHAHEEAPHLSEIVSAEIPKDLQSIVSRCLEKLPESRFPTMQELEDALAEVAPERPGAAHQTVSRKSSMRLWVLAGSVIGLSLIILSTFTMLREKPSGATKQSKKPQTSIKPGINLDVPEDLENQSKPHLDRNGITLLCNIAEVTSDQLEKLDLSKVRIIQFYGCEIKDRKVWTIVGKLPNLERLILVSCRGISEDMLDLLASGQEANKPDKRRLFIVDFTNTDLKTGSLAPLSRIRTLQCCYIASTDITDDDMLILQKLPLRYIKINKTAISDKGLMRLAKIKSLQELHIGDNQITEKGIARFRRMLPSCRIKQWSEEVEERQQGTEFLTSPTN